MADTAEKTEAQGEDGERERSTILFPYSDLDNAIRVVMGVHTVGGTACEWEQLAAQLNVAATGGGYRLMMLAAKIFGLANYGQGKVSLTPLGLRMTNPADDKAAKVEAFLTVPLYRAIYEKYKGVPLPPAGGLENEMAALGVAPKQKDKARQVFQRSAQQAGFFAHGPGRLVKPSVPGAGAPVPEQPKPEHVDKPLGGGGNGGGGTTYHPFIEGLLTTLPPASTEWKLDGRRKWLQAAANLFDLIYIDTDDSGKSLAITVKDESAK